MEFGEYAVIEQKRFGVKNEMYTHKVIGSLSSNGYVDVPVQCPATETLHEECVPVVACICCGVQETEVRKYRLVDVRPSVKLGNPKNSAEKSAAVPGVQQTKFSSFELYEEWVKSTDHSHGIYQGGRFFMNWLKTKKHL